MHMCNREETKWRKRKTMKNINSKKILEDSLNKTDQHRE